MIAPIAIQDVRMRNVQNGSATFSMTTQRANSVVEYLKNVQMPSGALTAMSYRSARRTMAIGHGPNVIVPMGRTAIDIVHSTSSSAFRATSWHAKSNAAPPKISAGEQKSNCVTRGAAMEKQQKDVRTAIERARDELERNVGEAKEKISAEIRRAEESGEKEKVEALRRQLAGIRHEAEEQTHALDEKLKAVTQEMRRAFDEQRFAAGQKAGDMREMAERMQNKVAEQQRAIAEKLEAAHKAGDKAAIEKLHAMMEKMQADQAMMQQNLMQSLGGKMDKGMAAKMQAEMRKRGGMPGGPEAQREMMQMIKELRGEVQELRREVRELRESVPKKKAKNQSKEKNASVPMLEEIPYVGQLFRKASPAEADANRIQVEVEEEELYRPKLKQDNLELQKNKAASDLEIRYARNAAEIAKKDWEKAQAANKSTKGAVSDIELARLKLLYEKALLEVKRAKQSHLGHVKALESPLQNLNKPADVRSATTLTDVENLIERVAPDHSKEKLINDKDNDKNKAEETAAPSNDKAPEPAKP